MPATHKKRQANDWSRLVDQVRAELIAAGNPKPKLKEVLQVASSRYVKKPKVKAAKKAKPAAAAVEPESPIPEAPVVAVAAAAEPVPVVAAAEPVTAPIEVVAEPVSAPVAPDAILAPAL